MIKVTPVTTAGDAKISQQVSRVFRSGHQTVLRDGVGALVRATRRHARHDMHGWPLSGRDDRLEAIGIVLDHFDIDRRFCQRIDASLQLVVQRVLDYESVSGEEHSGYAQSQLEALTELVDGLPRGHAGRHQ